MSDTTIERKVDFIRHRRHGTHISLESLFALFDDLEEQWPEAEPFAAMLRRAICEALAVAK
jgi:hypothetical protein